MSCCLLSRCIHGIHNVLKIKPMTSPSVHAWTSERFESCKFHLSSSILKRSVFLAWIVHRPFASLPCPPWPSTAFTNCFPKTRTQIGSCFLNLRRWLIDLVLPYIFHQMTMFHLVLTTSCIVSNRPFSSMGLFVRNSFPMKIYWLFCIQCHQFLSSRDACLDLGIVRIGIYIWTGRTNR
jgi:hypothetical protein